MARLAIVQGAIADAGKKKLDRAPEMQLVGHNSSIHAKSKAISAESSPESRLCVDIGVTSQLPPNNSVILYSKTGHQIESDQRSRRQPYYSRQQRSLKYRSDDSLFRPFVQNKNGLQTPVKSTYRVQEIAVRATPKRSVVKELSSNLFEPSAQVNSSNEEDSEWLQSPDDESDTDYETSSPESAFDKFPSSNAPAFRERLGSLQLVNSSARPSTPRQGFSKSKLLTLKNQRSIPPTPHHPTADLFWSQDFINEWNDEYSPQKNLRSPSKKHFFDDQREREYESISPLSSPRKSSSKPGPFKKDKANVVTRKSFNAHKHRIAEEFLHDLDKKVTNGEIQKLAMSMGGIQLIWSKKLNSTAGRANWRREAVTTSSITPKDSDSIPEGTIASTTVTVYRHSASIELAEKVIDDEERLLNVLAHEYCHLANFMISNVKDQPHGASFKSWAAKVTRACKDHRAQLSGLAVMIEVTTKHSYAISYKYAWRCSSVEECGVLYERHSRSIDPAKSSCGKCKSKLVQTRPAPRKNRERLGTDENTTASKSAYQIFVKQNFGTLKKELGPGTPHKTIMQELGTRYRESKASNQITSTTQCFGDAESIVPAHSDQDETQEAIDTVSRVLKFLTIG